MSCFYHVTSQKATAVSHSFTCSFTGSKDLNLIVGKLFYFEVYLITSEGLRLLKELPINGRISAAVSFRRNGRKQDSIIVVTEKADAAIIDCVKRSEDRLDFVTYANGNIGDNCSISSDGKHKIIVDPTSQIILFKFFDGVFKAILMKDLRENNSAEGVSQSLNVVAFRVEDGNIKGIFSLYGSSEYATIGLFVEDNKILNMKSFKMSFNQVDVTPDDWKIDSLPPDTQFIIPVEAPYCGLLIVGNKNVCYYNKQGIQIPAEIPLHKASTVVCYEKIDVHKYLLGDIMGQLFIMYLYHDGPGTSSSTTVMPNCLHVVKVGEVCIPETLTYLDNGVVFVGSHLGDSLLIQLINNSDNNVATTSGGINTNNNNIHQLSHGDNINDISVQILQTYTNVGPIIDIELMEVNGQNQLLLCSGAYKEGSIKVVRNGIGIHELLVMEQAGLTDVWSLQFCDSSFIQYIVGISWFSRTEILALEDEDLSIVPCVGVDKQSPTLLLASVLNGTHLVQVTNKQIRLISMCSNDGSQFIYWQPDLSANSNEPFISMASCHNNQIVISCACIVFHLIITDSAQMQLLGYKTLSHEIACLNLSSSIPNIAAVSYWIDKSVSLIDLTTMEPIITTPLITTGILPRSILIIQFQNRSSPYLMIGMDNGNLIYFQIDLAALENKDMLNVLSEQRRVTIGTGPYMKLNLWNSMGQSQEACVFVCSNHPSIIHCSDGRLLFSSINLKNEVAAMSPINSPTYKNCLMLVSETNIILGSIDKIQKLHVRSVPLKESVRRMAIQRETDTMAVLTMRCDTYVDGSFKPMHKSVTTNSRVAKSYSISPDINKRTVMRKLRDLESSHLVILNQATMEPAHVHSFYTSEDLYEQAICITTMQLPISVVTQKIVSQSSPEDDENSLGIDSHDVHSLVTSLDSKDDPMLGSSNRSSDVIKMVPVFVVGTCYVTDDEKEPNHGALYVFYFNERTGQCNLLKTIRIHGTPFAMQEFDNNRLLLTINSSVQLVDLTKGESELYVVCRYDDMIMALYLKRKDDFVLVGDLMRSVTLLRYKPNMSLFELIAQHRAPHWTTAIEFVDDDKLLVAEAEMNIFVVSRDFDTLNINPGVNPTSASTTDNTATNITAPNTTTTREERFRLNEYASIHTGLIINKFISGNILMQPLLDEYSIKLKNSILYGSTTGTIGQVFEISQMLYNFLKNVENQMQIVLVPVGNFSHETWRSFVKIRQCRVAERFIDGDLVENFQNLELADKQKIVKELLIPTDFTTESAEYKRCTVEDLSRIIEELSRFH